MITKQPDWEAIERAYRAGLLSLRAIASEHGVAHNTIMKRAEKEGWQRDLTSKVRSVVKDKVTRAVTTDGDRKKLVTDAEIIEEASDQAAAVVLAHRSGLAQWRGIASKLSTFLSSVTVTEETGGTAYVYVAGYSFGR